MHRLPATTGKGQETYPAMDEMARHKGDAHHFLSEANGNMIASGNYK